MAHNVRVRPVGFWTFNSAISPAEFELIDSQLAGSLAGDAGGTYAPSSLITIGGMGLTLTGPFDADDVANLEVTGSARINLGATFLLFGNQIVNAAAIVGFASGSFLTMQSGSTFTMNAGSTATIAAATTISGALTCSGAVTVGAAGTFTTSVGSVSTFNGAFTANAIGTFTKGVTVTQSTSNAAAVTATGNGSGAGAALTGGPTAPGLTAAPGTASTAAVPQCGGEFAGFVEITAADPSQGVAPPAGRSVFYGLSGCKAYCTVLVAPGAGPYALADDHNIDVVDEVATGIYSVTFLEPMASAAYSVVFSTSFAGRGVSWSNKTANGFRFTVFDTVTQAAIGTALTVDFQVFGRR
jgi:hypothetical protein